MTAVDLDRSALEQLCRKHHIRRLSVFGSRRSGRQTPESDLDLLVEFDPGHVPGFAFAAIERELSQLFGSEVDLRMSVDLNRRFRDEVSRTAEPIYVADDDERLRHT